MLSDKLQPLVDGVQKNREHWLEIADEQSLLVGDPQEKDSNDNVALSKPATPDSDSQNSPLHNCTESLD